MISSKYIGSLTVVMLLAFSVMAQSTTEKKTIKKNETAKVQSNVIKSITYTTKPLINKKMATVHPDKLIKRAAIKANSEENKKPNSKAIEKQ